MALSPSIPTSFVPKQPVTAGRKKYSAGNNIFLIVSLVIAGLALLASGGVFLYSNYLASVEKSKGAELTAAQQNVSATTVEQFVRLRNRLSSASTLLNQHVELSQFFTMLESITLQSVHFTNLTVAVATDGSAAIHMAGVARNFNALAAESSAFASQKNVQSAIFSGINVNQDNTVAFTLNATLAPGLVTESAAPTSAVVLPGSTASTSAPSFTTTTASTSSATTVATTTKTSTTTQP